MPSSFRRRKSRWKAAVVLLFLVLFCNCHVTAEDDDEGKELPELGDDACLTLDERQELSTNGDVGVWFNPCTTPKDVTIPSNGISLPLYVAMPAFSWSFDVPIAFLTVNYLSEDLSPAYYISMPSLGLVSIFSTVAAQASNTTIAEISLLDIHTEIIQQRSRKTWWRKYLLVFTCNWGPAATPSLRGKPITDNVVLKRLATDLERSLRQFLDVLSVFELERLSNGTLAAGADDPRERPFAYQTFGNWSITTDGSIEDGGRDDNEPPTFIEPTTSLRETGSFTTRVRVREWDWHRSLGLWMLLGTVALAVVVSHIAGARRRRDRRPWATAAGVEDLLDVTRWKLEESAMQQKAKESRRETYRDNDVNEDDETNDELDETVFSETTVSHRQSALRGETEYLHRIAEEDFYDEESVI